MGACVLCDKLPVVCILPDSRKSKETGHLTPLTFTKVRWDSDFCYWIAVAWVSTSLVSAFISVKLCWTVQRHWRFLLRFLLSGKPQMLWENIFVCHLLKNLLFSPFLDVRGTNTKSIFISRIPAVLMRQAAVSFLDFPHWLQYNIMCIWGNLCCGYINEHSCVSDLVDQLVLMPGWNVLCIQISFVVVTWNELLFMMKKHQNTKLLM